MAGNQTIKIIPKKIKIIETEKLLFCFWNLESHSESSLPISCKRVNNKLKNEKKEKKMEGENLKDRDNDIVLYCRALKHHPVMVLKRQFGEEGSENSQIADHSETQPTKFRKAVNYVLKEAYLQELAAKISSILEPELRRVVKEEVEPLIFSLRSSPRRTHQPESSSSRILQLCFTKKLPSTLFTNSNIQDEEHAPLQIKLVDARTNDVIQHGPLSSLKVEVLVLSADFVAKEHEDWSESEFKQNIVRERDGKRPLLVGDLSFPLVNGTGSIDNVAFTDNSSWVRSRKFRLGVRALSSTSGGTAIREAVSEAFVVLDHRGESYQKHNTPSLDDPVWRLKKISRTGASRNKLESHGIVTVKDFLMQYHMNPSFLRRVLGKGVPNRAWETMVKHANDCSLDDTCYSYYDAAERVELLFNCVYKLIAVKFEGQNYQLVDALDYRQKAIVDKLKQFALINPNELVQFHSSPATSSLAQSTIQQNIPFSGANLGLHQDGLSMIHQGEPKRQLDFNLSDSASYRCTVDREDGYLPEDDSTAQSDQPVQGLSPAALLIGDSMAEPAGGICNWYQNSPITTLLPNSQFRELFNPQTSPLYPLATTWGQEDGILTASPPATRIGFLSQLPDLGVNISGTRKPKAGWCKIRAAVMWKIVRRDAAAKRKAKFPFYY